jgi:hypothetical protein
MDVFLSTISGVLAGGFVTYIAQWGADRRRTKREGIEGIARLYDRATDALAAVEASRRGPAIRLKDIGGLSDEQLRNAEEQLSLAGLKRHQETQWELRAAMAALPAAEDFRRFWDKDNEPNEAEVGEGMRLLAERRELLYERRRWRPVSLASRLAAPQESARPA